mmetsp:Transcript_15139/g.52691  ORF Transcript_15139/g.52691 Transcript_15139/m.52691 type:complete len:187 (-) Transcript_15139:41-601(-)
MALLAQDKVALRALIAMRATKRTKDAEAIQTEEASSRRSSRRSANDLVALGRLGRTSADDLRALAVEAEEQLARRRPDATAVPRPPSVGAEVNCPALERSTMRGHLRDAEARAVLLRQALKDESGGEGYEFELLYRSNDLRKRALRNVKDEDRATMNEALEEALDAFPRLAICTAPPKLLLRDDAS